MSRRIKTAVVGIGNCASSLVQAVAAAKRGELKDGVTHPELGGYGIDAIDFVAAFDVDERKVGQDLATAITAEPNCTTSYIEVPPLGVPVSIGPLLDGVAPHLSELVKVAPQSASVTVEQVAATLRERGAEVVVIYLPVGSSEAAQAYARAALMARCALVNCTPAVLAASEQLSRQFKEAGLPLLGDDIKSHLGGTTMHRALLTLLQERGIRTEDTYQLNIGGNTDFLNMRDPQRVRAKRVTKAEALKHLLPEGAKCAVGPSDYIPHLDDHKVCYLNIKASSLLGMSVTLDVKLTVEDSPNAAAVTVDCIRLAKISLDRKLTGTVDPVCPTLFKRPPIEMTDLDARLAFKAFIGNNADH